MLKRDRNREVPDSPRCVQNGTGEPSCDGRRFRPGQTGQCSVENSEQSFQLAIDGSMQLQWPNHWTGVLSYTAGPLIPWPLPCILH